MRARAVAAGHPGRAAAYLLAAGLAVAACGRAEGPAPVEYGQGGETRASTASTTAERGDEAGEPGVHTVRKGQTVYGIARRYGVSIRAVIDANGLSPPYDLRVGQELRIPVPDRYVVERGDTLYSISRRFGVDMNELAERNGIGPPYLIHPGDDLTIPDGDAARVAETGQRERQAGTQSTERGQSGTPGESRSAGRVDRTSTTNGGSRAGVDMPTPRRKPRRLAQRRSGSDGGGESAQTQQAGASGESGAIADPPQREAGSFLWPVDGEVVAEYGPKENGLHNDGINIAAPSGTAIRAAASGVVAYVGDELRGFGKLVLVKHADGWVTAYAHASAIIVEHGQRVERGQVLARVGSTGNVPRPQLHFEVRKGSQAIDPREVMSSARASRTDVGTG